MHDAVCSGAGPIGSWKGNPSMLHPPASTPSERPVLAVIAVVLLAYLGAAAVGWPQAGTDSIVKAAGHDAPHAVETSAGHDAHHAHEAPAGHGAMMPPYYTVLPFLLLLGAIAVLPLLRVTEHWWESNLHRFYVAAGLGLLTLVYYALFYGQAIERHFLGHAVIAPSGGVIDLRVAWTVLENAILNEYVPFIMLLFSLYTISGGIRIEGDLRAHPLTNTTFIGLGGALASFIGTTGAAMLLIRPLLETNSERRHVTHTVVFFIFVVCNCGGCLLPIGDPPLFLGYLKGVDFLWTLTLWRQWLFVNGALLLVYYLWDHFWCYPREAQRDIAADERQVRRLTIVGLWPNALLLGGVVLSVALLDPSKPLPGTHWHPWLYLREVVQLALVGLSLWLGSPQVRRQNRFSYGAIIEVAALFSGIFICMQPALQILNVQGASLGINTPERFFWATGLLSSVLDNAPTYVVFFETARALGTGGASAVAGVAEQFLVPISLGAVFMGAMTYIGNGPNFMVKTIAESARVRMPSFFGYVLYSGAVLVPIFLLCNWLFM